MEATETRSFRYPVEPRHSTVLGYSATSLRGGALWDELDWTAVRKDGGLHMMNPAGGEYLHVRCHPSEEMDGTKDVPVDERRWYRVRCSHSVGMSWRGGKVADVKLHRSDAGWEWEVIVRDN